MTVISTSKVRRGVLALVVLGTFVAVSPDAVAQAAAPANIVPPSISGEAHPGRTLTCWPGEWTGEPQFTYSWDGYSADDTPTYTPVNEDVLHSIACEVTATDGEGSASMESNAISVTTDPSCSGSGFAQDTVAGGSAVYATPVWVRGFAELCPQSSSELFLYRPHYGTEAEELYQVGRGGLVTADQAPDDGEISALGRSELRLIVAPVAQTAIAVIADPPAGCSVGAITNQELEQAMRGNVFRWSRLATAHGECDSPLRRVVPDEGTAVGTQLKDYLSTINPNPLPCMTGAVSWDKTSREKEERTRDWPRNCAGTPLSPLERTRRSFEGPYTEVETVRAIPGSLGFAALPAAEAGGAQILELQNNGWKPAPQASFAEPALDGNANCEGASYSVPPAGRRVPGATPLDVDWSQVTSGHPAVGGSAYPLCMLTYMVTVSSQDLTTGPTVKDFIREYVVFAGQPALRAAQVFMAPVPSVPNPAHDVLGAARFAASMISTVSGS